LIGRAKPPDFAYLNLSIWGLSACDHLVGALLEALVLLLSVALQGIGSTSGV
jgi:hypothetical protein